MLESSWGIIRVRRRGAGQWFGIKRRMVNLFYCRADEQVPTSLAHCPGLLPKLCSVPLDFVHLLAQKRRFSLPLSLALFAACLGKPGSTIQRYRTACTCRRLHSPSNERRQAKHHHKLVSRAGHPEMAESDRFPQGDSSFNGLGTLCFKCQKV